MPILAMIARIRSLAVTPSGSSPSTVMAMVLGRASGSVWVASTCSTCEVPMPNARRAEGAVRGGVGVTADDGHAGLGQTQLRADDVHDALLDVAQRVQPDAELGAVLAQRLQLDAGDRVRDGLVDVEGRGVVVLGRDGEVEAAHLAAALAQTVEGLRAGHLVQQVQIDEEEVGLALGAPDDVVVPDLLRECPTHRFPSGRPVSRRPN